MFCLKISHTVSALGLLLLSVPAMAQERAAGGTADLQMTWSALSNVAKAAQAKADAVNSRVDQVVVCGAKGMIYSPGAAGVDGQGCVNPKKTIDTTNYDRMLSCANQGLVYQVGSNSCIMGQANSQTPNCTMKVTSEVNENNKSCPGNTVPIGGVTSYEKRDTTEYSTHYSCYSVICQ